MRDQKRTAHAASSERTSATTFYDLGFAGQMVVWAVRKRLHMLAGGADDARVAQAFELADLGAVYESIATIADVLACGPSRRIELHAVACPCLAPHELAVLDALAHLCDAKPELAFETVARFVGRPAASLVWPSLLTIARELEERALSIEHCADGYAPAEALRRVVH